MATDGYFIKFANAVASAIDGPVTWWKEQVVEPNQKKYNWYHRKYRRVPTIDQCYTDDPVCTVEANMQFVRDKEVEAEILAILRGRYMDCIHWEGAEHEQKCRPLWEIYQVNAGHWFCKYGDLGPLPKAIDAYMKQKHRLIWERRYGPVGTGMNPKEPVP